MKNETPIISVIISTYNKKEALKYAIESVLWQTYHNFELWVIGDACTDGTEEMILSYNDDRLKWYNLPKNSGYQSEPNNEGIRRSKGKYIAYLNHDDIWIPQHLEILLEHIERSGADFVYSALRWLETWAVFGQTIPEFPHSPLSPEAIVVMHKRSVIDKIGYWKKPSEVYSIPREDFFRQAQFSGMSFEFVPALTAFKFGISKNGYSLDVGQNEIINKIKNDPFFVHKELAEMLYHAHKELQRPISWNRFKFQIQQSIRRFFIKKRIDPASIKIWAKKGKQISDWQKIKNIFGTNNKSITKPQKSV